MWTEEQVHTEATVSWERVDYDKGVIEGTEPSPERTVRFPSH